MTSTIIIPSEAILSVPIPPSYIGKEVEVSFALVNGVRKPKTEIKSLEKFRGVLSQESDYDFFYSVSEHVLAKDWLNAYEDEAWKNL